MPLVRWSLVAKQLPALPAGQRPMSRKIHPLGLKRGDVAAPTFDPDLRVVVDRVGLSTLADALPGKYNRDLPPDTKVRLIFGANQVTDEPERLLVGQHDLVLLVERDGERVER